VCFLADIEAKKRRHFNFKRHLRAGHGRDAGRQVALQSVMAKPDPRRFLAEHYRLVRGRYLNKRMHSHAFLTYLPVPPVKSMVKAWEYVLVMERLSVERG
jgi:hypothetical protein